MSVAPPPTTSSSSSISSSASKKKQSKKKTKTKKRAAKGMTSRSRRSSVSNDECLASFFQQDENSLAMAAQARYNDLDASFHSVCTSIPQEEEEPYKQHLPKSLQRPQHPRDLTDMPDSLFDNFSTLFGIGQHITLTPTNPLIDLGIPDADESNSSLPLPASLAHLCQSLVGRHQPQQARWVLTQLLGTWMQTALNCAAQNCQSCLPVFGSFPNIRSPDSLSAFLFTSSTTG